jgi:serine/threonine protein phosphatase 1
MDAGYDVQCVKGNHEDMMFVTTARFDGLSLWLQNGGGECLVSYGINKVPQDGPYGTARFPENYLDMIPQRHKDFFESLPVYLVIDDYIFVHGGLNFYLDNALKTPKDDMMWERMSMKYRSDSVSGKKVVFGHTPRAKSQIELDKDKDCIVIDNGCVFGHESEFKYGSLCCLTIEKKGTRTLTFTKKCDNVQDDANPRFL